MNQFAPTSRYANIEQAQLTLPCGRIVVYLRRRFAPPPESFSEIQTHIVHQGDRLDNLAGHYLGDAEQFWRICDANNAMHPDDLTCEIGRRLRITLPEGIQGSPYAQ